MTDDLEPRLRDHLRHRADRVATAPDVADLHDRIDGRQRRRTRAVGAALALALVAGPLGGWALGRAGVDDRDAVAALGGSGDAGGSGVSVSTTVPSGEGGLHHEERMQLVSERTTAEDIRLLVRSTGLGAPDGDSCAVDGLVRVGVVADGLVDVAFVESAPARAALSVVGGADGRPVWLVIARATGTVIATFPNGTTDEAAATDGVAVLAAFGPDGASSAELMDDVVQVSGLPGGEDGTQPVSAAIGPCPPDGTPVAPPVDLTMPEPGEPPADEASAREQIEELFSGYGGQDPDIEVDEHERPNVWRDADRRFREEHPDYLAWAKESYLVPLEIVFTAPDRATVRYDIRSDDPDIPSPGQRLGEAVLIDGTWKVSIETSCADIALAGIECDFSIEG